MSVNDYRETWIEVNLDAIHQNIEALREIHHKEMNVMAVVKANGYGHGAVEVAKTAIGAGASVLGTALMEEALELREAGIKTPIVVLGPTSPEAASRAATENISLTAFQTDWLTAAITHIPDGSQLKVHVKYDTGMGRVGATSIDELKEVIDLVQLQKKLSIEGLFTHLATADEWDDSYYRMQMQRFEKAVAAVRGWVGDIPFIHCANSAASMRYPSACYNMVRFGISMYGLLPAVDIESALPFPLHPAMSLHSKLTHVKQIKAGSSVSYGATYTAQEDEWIGTVPIGYGDGWLRANANKGDVLIEGHRAQIVGRICMDQMMIKLPYKLSAGTLVTLIGKNGDESVPIEEIAERLDTITYEVPCLLNQRIPRKYYT